MIGILVIALLLRLIDLTQSLSFSEAGYLLAAEPKVLPLDNLFTLLLHYWLKLNSAEWFLRLPSLIFGLGSIYLLAETLKLLEVKEFRFRFFKKKLKINPTNLAALFLALNPLHIHFSTRITPLSLATFLSILSWYFLFRYLKRKKNVDSLFFWFITLLNLLTFNPSIFNLGLQFIYFFLYHRKYHPKFLFYGLLALILFSANIFALIVPKRNEDWRSAADFLNNQDDLVIFATQTPPPMLWYGPDLKYLNPLHDLAKDPILFDLSLSQATVGVKDIYYFRYLEDKTDPSRNIITWLTNAGYVLVDSVKFTGVGYVDHYQSL